MPGALDDDVSVHALTFPVEALPIESLRATPFDLQKMLFSMEDATNASAERLAVP